MDRARFQKQLSASLAGAVRKRLRPTFLLRAFSWIRIPLLFSVRPTIVELSDERSVVRIKLSRWTRNHWGSMYFGTLAIGADCAVGMLAMHHIWKLEADDVQLLFKDFQAQFLKRPGSDVLFICDEGARARALVLAAKESGERQNLTLQARAVLEKKPSVPVAEFSLTLSLKRMKKT